MILVAATDEPARVDAQALLRRLEEGVQSVMSSEGWRSFLTAQAKFHSYSAGNVLLILAQNPQATRVAGFHTWRDLGRNVKKGEHGIAILAPVFPKREQEPRMEPEPAEGQGEERKPAVALDSSRLPVRFRVAHVFDVSQTEGKPLPEPPVHELRGGSAAALGLTVKLMALAQAEGLAVAIQPPERMPRGAKGYYDPLQGRIVLSEGLAPDQKAKTLAHELAHHRLEHGRGRAPGRPTEEAEAEGVAFVVCAHYGLDTSDYSFGYVANWSRDEGGPALVKQVSAAIQGAARDMIDGMEPKKTPVTSRVRTAQVREAEALER